MSDPVIARTVENAVGLRAASVADAAEVLGIYSNRSGDDVFVIEREGVRFLPEGRLVAYGDIEALSFDSQVKESVEARKLMLALSNGEQLTLPVDGQGGKFLDIFPIHAFLRRRAHQHRTARPTVSSQKRPDGRRESSTAP